MYDCQFSDEIWMRYAITLGNFAKNSGEVSVGAVLVLNERVIGQGWNSSIAFNDPTAHAEMIAIRQGGRVLANYRLLNTTLYVTLEPCMMCFGAMLHARVFRLVFGVKNRKNGIIFSKKSIVNYLTIGSNHHIIYTSGVLKEMCSTQILDFFYQRRLKRFLK